MKREFSNTVVVDCKDHLLGRLASVVAKQLLNGRHVVLVRCEQINICGHFVRNKLKFLSFLHKHTNPNHMKGHVHYRAPSRIMWRTVRGMLPHKLPRGAAALSRLSCYDGCPEEYARVRKACVPQAMRVLRLKPRRKYTELSRLASECGWKHREMVETMEARRLERGHTLYLANTARNAPKLDRESKVDARLAELGY